MGGCEQEDIQDYLESLQRRGCSPRTVAQRRHVLNRLRAFAAAQKRPALRALAPEHLELYQRQLAERGLSVFTARGMLQVARHFYRWLTRTGRVFADPSAALLLPRRTSSLRPAPTEEEVERFLARPDTGAPLGVRDRAFFETAYSTAARLGELLRLDRDAIRLEEGVLRVLGKGGKERLVPVGREAARWLSVYLRKARPYLIRSEPAPQALWLSSRGEPLTASPLQQRAVAYSRAAGISPPITLHALRRACATHMLRHGAHPLQIQALLGHADLHTLGHYLRLTVADLKRAHLQTKPGQ